MTATGNYYERGPGGGDHLERTCKVGSYEQNKFGLYDMHGNVWEWCSHRYDEKYFATSPTRDPVWTLRQSGREKAGRQPPRPRPPRGRHTPNAGRSLLSSRSRTRRYGVVAV